MKLTAYLRRPAPFAQYLSGSYMDSFLDYNAGLPSMNRPPCSIFFLWFEACCCFLLRAGVCPVKFRELVAAMRVTLVSFEGALKVKFICLAPSSWLRVPPSPWETCFASSGCFWECSPANFYWYFLSCSSKPRLGQTFGLIFLTYLSALLKIESYFFM